MSNEELVYVGIKRHVVALSRGTGQIVWSTKLGEGFLTGRSFMHVIVDGNDLYATTQGVISCLDAATGKVRWHNELKGYGLGIASIATRNTCSPADLAAQAIAQEQESAATTAATVSIMSS